MDTKRLIVTMMLSMVIIFGWQIMVARWQQQNMPPAATQPIATTTTAPTVVATTTGAAATQPAMASTSAAPTSQAQASIAAGKYSVASPTAQTTQPAVVSIGESDQFNTKLNINLTGGGLASAVLKEHKAADGKGLYTFQTPADPQKLDTASLALRKLVINGTELDVSNATWQVQDGKTDKFVGIALEILDQGQPAVRVIRTFEVSPKSSDRSSSQGYDHAISQSFENLGNAPLNIKAIFNGPTEPPREIERGPDLYVIGGYNDDREVTVYNHAHESFDQKTPTLDLTLADNKYRFLWLGAGSVYFDAILRPDSLDPNDPSPKYIAKATGEALNPTSEPHERLVRITFETDQLQLLANQKLKTTGSLFLGPKQRALLNSPYYEAFPKSYDRALVIARGPCSVCTFQPLINALVMILRGFHFVLRDWGLAIIALVLLVRALLHPITKRSQVSMLKMGKMGPEIERLKKKYGDNKDELNKAMMQVYKEQGFTPVLGCLPMFLQMPIWIALWQALQTTFELRQAEFLWGLTWIHDLAKPDQLIKFSHPIPLLLFGWQLHAINLLPILMVGVTYMNQKFMPKPVATTPEQEQQQKMMMWMTLVFPLMFYTFPSGLNLYYVTSMGLGIIESKIVRDHIKKKEEEEKSGKVIVDAAPTRAMKRRKDDEGGSGAKTKPNAPAPKSGPMKWLADLQAKAEEVRREAERGRK